MKRFIMIAGAMLLAAPAQAGLVILPNLFAREYCQMRDMGADHSGALEYAVGESVIEGNPVKVTINGVQYDADVVKANRTAMERCPRYF